MASYKGQAFSLSDWFMDSTQEESPYIPQGLSVHETFLLKSEHTIIQI